MVDVFNVEVYFIVLRESLEAIIVVSVLLAFLKQGLGKATDDPAVYKRLVRQVYIGAFTGVLVCLIIGAAFIGTYYSLGNDIWSESEDIWEGTFCVFATVLISIMGVAMLRINKMQEKWRIKIAKALLASPDDFKGRFKLGYLTKKYAMFVLPFITCLREGLEAVVFVGGVGLVHASSARAYPLPVVCGLISGMAVGVFLYYGGSRSSLQVFLCISTAILYLISAGLFSRAVWDFETNEFNNLTGGDASESGDGAGSYDITKSVWHVNCCNPELDNGWDVFNALLGWQNSASYGSVISYNVYWIFLMAVLLLMLYEEKHGHLPFCKKLRLIHFNPMYWLKNKKKNELTQEEQEELFRRVQEKFAKTANAEEDAGGIEVSEKKTDTGSEINESADIESGENNKHVQTEVVQTETLEKN
ncbi:hypothetical protein PACTADRAFT_40864 [Pachysolen tannophilus NRRL Y-2460]|uniref:Uncharacterized protein n=1 Tax=Pachysolen tannophilus NRRL Y-2460 TaxID=669874 RepID=A0A1E4TWL2_PACTA|nr:hypothetical protein PACTADRAFT_40864 [Pachysolen tannophilus NRRL Y-2460]